MDLQFILVLVIVAFAIAAPWLEKLNKKLKAFLDAQPQTPRQSVRRAPQPLKYSDFAPRTRNEAAKLIALATEEAADILPEEGVRVTEDVTETKHRQDLKQPKLEPLRGDELRKALIWGEILKPKF